jgi:hypothetical protein
MTDNAERDIENLLKISYAEFLKEVYAGRVALIREFEKHIGKEEVHSLLKDFYNSQASASTKALVDRLDTPIESIEDFQKLGASLDARPFSVKTMVNEHSMTASGQFTRTTRHCLWADVFKDLDATDLGKIMLCDTDFPSTKAFNPRLRLERTKTIMQGDDCCNFVYHWDD